MTERNLKIAVVCSSNQNRSMEAHNFLSKRGFNIKSFGTGSQVKLPGPAPNQPNIYDFNTTYEEMYKDLSNKDKNLYLNLTPRSNQSLHASWRPLVEENVWFLLRM